MLFAFTLPFVRAQAQVIPTLHRVCTRRVTIARLAIREIKVPGFTMVALVANISRFAFALAIKRIAFR